MKTIVVLLLIAISGFAQVGHSSFMPEEGKYLVSGWVREDQLNQVRTYANSKIRVILFDVFSNPVDSYDFQPSGLIIEGWQRIVGEIQITGIHKFIEIQLLNDLDEGYVYFDDIRFFPYNGNMKTFVYSDENYRLMAELDENNYATFYEYDAEGGLVRVKKETEKGVYTIQETRTSTKKNAND
jgi:hypothetical protein